MPCDPSLACYSTAAASEALPVPRDHALGEPLRREPARELGALQLDRGHDGARERSPGPRIRQREDAVIEPGRLEVVALATLEVAADFPCIHAELGRDRTRRGFGRAGWGVAPLPRHEQVAIERELRSRQ